MDEVMMFIYSLPFVGAAWVSIKVWWRTTKK
jgi:hypothetical protein